MNRMYLAVLLGLALSASAWADNEQGEAGYPTNMAMLTEAAQASVSEMFLSFNAPAGSSILLESESAHEAKWFVENLILGQLTERGYAVTLKPEEPAKPGSGRPSSGDSLETAVPDTLAEDRPPGLFTDTLEMGGDVDYVLRFRVAECGLTYPRALRKSPLGTKLVQRFATVSVFGTLVRGDKESVVWVGRGDAERLDYVPSGKLALLEGKTFPFTHPEIESRGVGAYAEPALVLGIVLGLVYLFYTNQ